MGQEPYRDLTCISGGWLNKTSKKSTINQIRHSNKISKETNKLSKILGQFFGHFPIKYMLIESRIS